MTGNRVAHPLLLSIANIDFGFRMKALNELFVLLALFPVPKFIAPKALCGVLANRLIHACLDFIVKPLKKAAEIGFMMQDPLAQIRYCFTPLVGYIADYQEAVALACVAGKTSPVTMADYRQFGDSIRHEPRTADETLRQLAELRDEIDPHADVEKYFKRAKKLFRLNGVNEPFFRDWPMSNPSDFFTPEILHAQHKQFWDHDAKWCIQAIGGPEIDFRFSVLPRVPGYRHFKEGISKLKQVTGREHRDVQRYIVAIIAGAVSVRFVAAIRGLLDFRYFSQAPEIDDGTCEKLLAALKTFHDHKDAIMEANARVGKKGNLITDWNIPKLELMQSVVSNIRANGAACQWSADVTEHAHITFVKNPADHTNNQNYENQICRFLDRVDKTRRFDLATSIREAGVDLRLDDQADRDNDIDIDINDDMGVTNDIDDDDNETPVRTVSTSADLLDAISPMSASRHASMVDYFAKAAKLLQGQVPKAPLPYRTFIVADGKVCINLPRDHALKKTVDQVAELYALPDLRAALNDFLVRAKNLPPDASLSIGGRRIAPRNASLPFFELQVWSSLRIQSKAYHHPHNILPAQTLSAVAPAKESQYGKYDAAVVNLDTSKVWPASALDGSSHPSSFICIY